MNIERTAMFAVCVARGQTEGPGLARPGCKARDLICRNRVQGSCDSRIPSRCASIVGVEELWRLHAASNNGNDVGLQLLLHQPPHHKMCGRELERGHESMTNGQAQV